MFMAAMLLGPGVLFALSVLLGLWPWLANGLAAQASPAILGETAQVNLALWHGLNTPLMLSLMALAAGTGLYVVYGRAVHILAARQCSLGKPGKPSRFVLYWFLDESCESSDKSPVFG